MSKSFLVIIVLLCLGFIQKKDNFDFKILSKSLKIGDSISFGLKNNTRESYCFLIDTSFSCVEYPEYYYKGSFFSPKIELYDKDDIVINEVIFTNSGAGNFSREEKSKNIYKILGINQNKCGKLKLLIIKPSEILHFKMPLSFVNFLDESTFKYYALNGNGYYLQLNYLQEEKFIKERISKKTQDSLANKGIKFFEGQLKSNKIKLNISVEEYNTALNKLKNITN